MSFLKRFGTIVANIAGVVAGIGPLIPALIPNKSEQSTKVQNTVMDIAQVVLLVEAITASLGTKGPDKLKAAGPLVAQLVLQSDLMTGKKINDHTLFSEGCFSLTDGVVKILNSLKDNAIDMDKLPS